MATILFTWELGNGLGHMMQILPMARALARRGHRVFCALRELASARRVFGEESSQLLQAPIKTSPRVGHISPPRTLAHILSNVGYFNEAELAGLVSAWRAMFELIRPDLIVFDHSPTAMLASHGLAARRVAIGSGFGVPTDAHPLPNLRAWEPADPAKLVADELVVLDRMNRVLGLWHQPPLSRIGQIYSDLDDTFLLTFRELDHYANRAANTRYRGAWIKAEGGPPQWPDLNHSNGAGAGRRVFGYLKPFAGLPQLLADLRSLGCATLLYIENADPKLVQQFSGPTMAFANKRLDLSQVAAECDLAIMHGTHGTTLSMLMAGKPTLQLPLFLEQGLFASAVRRLGAALQPPLENPALIRRDLERMLSSPSFAEAARSFAARHAGFDPVAENEQMVARLEELANASQS